MAQSTAERKRHERERKTALGLKRVPDRWAHPEDIPAILDYIEKKNKKRGINT